MKRRDFIKTTAAASIPLMVSGIPVMASSQIENTSLEKMALAAVNCGRILVIVQQNGGNDGLNTVFALDKWTNLVNARSNILMNNSQVLPLNNNLTTGLHPAMGEMQGLYNNGKLMIVQGVSYPNPNFSHFRATDIWFTGSGSSTTLDSGWLGRALDIKYPNFPADFPSTEMPDPLAIQIGSTLPFVLQGQNINMGYSVTDPSALLNVINAITDPAPNNDYGHELTFLRLMKDQSNVYRQTIQTAYNVPLSNAVVYPTSNKLADQLKIVAKLINGGLKTPVYIVNHPNTHDTHENQVSTTDKTTGSQATNLTLLSQAIGAFQQDLDQMGKADKVAGMTFSEFGRRIKSNASLGTDHGSAAPVMFFGAALNTSPTAVAGTQYPVAGMIGTSPDIPLNATVSNQVPMQFDYRQLYASVMQDWLCMTEAEVTQVLGTNFAKLPIFNSVLLSSVDFDKEQYQDISVYPNPCSDGKLTIRLPQISNDYIQVSLLSINGTLLQTASYKMQGQELQLQYNQLVANAMYILHLDWNGNSFYKKIITN
nr:DUF1501 domain-containing protein [uncultured Flavobacterium sp.]